MKKHFQPSYHFVLYRCSHLLHSRRLLSATSKSHQYKLPRSGYSQIDFTFQKRKWKILTAHSSNIITPLIIHLPHIFSMHITFVHYTFLKEGMWKLFTDVTKEKGLWWCFPYNQQIPSIEIYLLKKNYYYDVLWKGYKITTVVFLPKMHNLSLIMRRYQSHNEGCSIQ